MQGFRSEYVYVDVHSSAQKQWRRVKIDQVDEKLLKPSKNFKCFKSVQRYNKAHAEPGEHVWMPLFFDLDNEKDPGITIDDVKKLYGYMTEVLQIHHHFVRMYFSGKKGFHVVIEPECFDIRPHHEIHLKIRKAALNISEHLDLKTFDSKVYSVRRVLRIHNSIHEGTKLFKIEVSLGDLAKGIDFIKEKAKRPQEDVTPEEPSEEVSISQEAKEFWDGIRLEVEEAEELSNLKPDHMIHDFGELPVCIKHMLSLPALPTSHSGNRTILSLAAYMKDIGWTEQKTVETLVPWLVKLPNIGNAGNPKAIEAGARATIAFVYRKSTDDKGDRYHFACKYILALSTPDHKIPCQNVQCPAVKGKMQETKETIDLSLDGFSKSIYLGEKVRVPTLISGKAGTPYVVPKRVRFTCPPDEDGEFCKNCPIAQFNGEASFEFDVKDPEILEIVNTSNKFQWEAIRRKFRFPPACSRCKTRVEEYMNIEEVRMSPAAVDVSDFQKSEFVNRKGFFIGYPLQSNKRFMVTGFPVKDPKTQTSAFLFQEHEKLETEIETFTMTPEIKAELEVFCAKEGDVEGKFEDIHNDLSTNVYRIWNRRDLAWAADLVVHSVRGFKFRSEPFVKGWIELLVVGDSGQGKTACVRRLVQGHYKVGEYVSGGASKRTGLLYSYQENGKTWMLIWGAMPLNDLGLLVVDEFGDMAEEEFALMTDVRSSGIVKAVGVVTAETFARVRLIALSNAKKGKHLAEYDLPVVAIKELVPAAEDIRRFDFALCVASGEVPVETINRADFEHVHHVYTSSLCRNLIRWAWSRKETEVEFTDGASKFILHEATRMAKDFYAGDIPLVEPADQRFKLARLAAAAAARVFSTDEKGDKIVVKEEHVGFIMGLLYEIYNNHNFKYGEWSRTQRKTESSGVEDLRGCLDRIMDLPQWKRIFGLLTLPGQIDGREVEGVMSGDRSKSSQVLALLRIVGLVEKKWGKYAKTSKCNQLVSWAFLNGHVKKEDIEREMMGPGGALSNPTGQKTFEEGGDR
jgi:hypothetical protein